MHKKWLSVLSPFFTLLALAPSLCLGGPTLAAIPLQINDLSYNQANEQLDFIVTNVGIDPVLAYVISISVPGHSQTAFLTRDFTATLPLSSRIVHAPPGTRLGLLPPYDSDIWSIRIPTHSMATNITVEPVAVVFSDNSVAGDVSLAEKDVFGPHRAILRIYQHHLDLLNNIAPSDDIRAGLTSIQQLYSDALTGKDSLTADPKLSHALQPTYKRLRLSTSEAVRLIDTNKATSLAALLNHSHDIQMERDAYLAHSQATNGDTKQ